MIHKIVIQMICSSNLYKDIYGNLVFFCYVGLIYSICCEG